MLFYFYDYMLHIDQFVFHKMYTLLVCIYLLTFYLFSKKVKFKSIIIYSIVPLIIWFKAFKNILKNIKAKRFFLYPSKLYAMIIVPVFLAFGISFFFCEFNLSDQEKITRAERFLKLEKASLKLERKKQIQAAKTKVKLAKIEARRQALYKSLKVNENANKVKTKQKIVKPKRITRSKSKDFLLDNEKKHLIISALWLGACFFLQRLFEKLFHDKGYALLSVCAVGFLIAFFTANYFLLPGSISGGLIGAVEPNNT